MANFYPVVYNSFTPRASRKIIFWQIFLSKFPHFHPPHISRNPKIFTNSSSLHTWVLLLSHLSQDYLVCKATIAVKACLKWDADLLLVEPSEQVIPFPFSLRRIQFISTGTNGRGLFVCCCFTVGKVFGESLNIPDPAMWVVCVVLLFYVVRMTTYFLSLWAIISEL